MWDEIWCKPASAQPDSAPEDDQRFAQPPPAEVAVAESPSDHPDEPVVHEVAGETSSAGDPPLQRAEPGGGCGACHVGHRGSSPAHLVWFFVGLGWWWRRRGTLRR